MFYCFIGNESKYTISLLTLVLHKSYLSCNFDDIGEPPQYLFVDFEGLFSSAFFHSR
jgi:hypothetical protein